MKLAQAAIGGLLLAAAPLAAMADDTSYSWIEADYVDLDLDFAGAPPGDGLALRGSVGFANNWFAFADYSSLEVDVLDIDLIEAGGGGHYSFAENFDVVGRVGDIQVDVSVPGAGDTDDDGYLVSLGVRGRLGDAVELEGSVMDRDTGGDGGSETEWTVAGRYHFNRFAVGAEYQMGDDENILYAGVRYSF